MLAGWAALTVGHQWPGDAPLAALQAAATARAAAAAAFEDYAGRLDGIARGPLAHQDGLAADAARARFRSGAEQALRIAERQQLAGQAYESARHCAIELRSALTAVARQAQLDIERIAASGEPAAARVTRIGAVVREAQARADGCAATHGGSVLSAIQSVLTGSGSPMSARRFAEAHGVDLDTAFRGSAAPVEAAVGALLGGAPDPGAPTAVSAPVSVAVSAPPPATPATSPAPPPRAVPSAAAPAPGRAAPPRPVPGAAAASSAPPTAAAVGARGVGSAHGPVTALRPPPAPAPRPGVPRAPAESAVEVPADETGLRRVLAILARQEPRVRWAVGIRADGAVVAATDLAGGWIPPHVGVPDPVLLPAPALRGDHLAAILGDTVQTLGYLPGGPLPPVPPGGPEPVSDRPRRVAAVDDLGWELGRATRWRDGLPRLAHTLAVAAAAGTGCPASELQLLSDHLGRVRRRVLDRYPGAADPAEVGNWKLLAAVQALALGEPVLGQYHFAWFRLGTRCPT